jgi:hypothetical protein
MTFRLSGFCRTSRTLPPIATSGDAEGVAGNPRGQLLVLEADLRAYLDSIDQNRLVDLICNQISDGRVLQLIRDLLKQE